MRLKLHDTMPFSRGLRKEVLYTFLSGALALMIFYVLRPFRFRGLSNYDLLGFGMISILSGTFYIILTHYLYRSIWGNRKWTIGLEILHSLFFLLFIGFAIWVYSYSLHIADLSLHYLVLYLFYTIALGIVPITIRAILIRNWRLKKELSDARKINELLANRKMLAEEKIFELRGPSPKDFLKLSTDELLYIEAAENYITVVWQHDHTIKKEMIRMTMKDAIRQINDPMIVFSHRSFIINLRKVQKISIQSGFSAIVLDGTEALIPLSVTYKKTIAKKLKEI